MTAAPDKLAEQVEARFKDALKRIPSAVGELTYEVEAAKFLEVSRVLRDDKALKFEQLIDVCGVDNLAYGDAEWRTENATKSGFSRGVRRMHPHELGHMERRYAVVYHLLSVSRNERLRIKVFCGGEPPVVPSATAVWASANWF